MPLPSSSSSCSLSEEEKNDVVMCIPNMARGRKAGGIWCDDRGGRGDDRGGKGGGFRSSFVRQQSFLPRASTAEAVPTNIKDAVSSAMTPLKQMHELSKSDDQRLPKRAMCKEEDCLEMEILADSVELEDTIGDLEAELQSLEQKGDHEIGLKLSGKEDALSSGLSDSLVTEPQNHKSVLSGKFLASTPETSRRELLKTSPNHTDGTELDPDLPPSDISQPPTTSADMHNHDLSSTSSPQSTLPSLPTLPDRKQQEAASIYNPTTAVTLHQQPANTNKTRSVPSHNDHFFAPKMQQRLGKGQHNHHYCGDLIDRLADFTFGHHCYEARPIFLFINSTPSSSKAANSFTRSYEGGIAVYMATLLMVTSFYEMLPPLSFWMTLAFIPPILTALEVHVPHRLEESAIALGIVIIRLILAK